jgi:hypothetical protein
LAHVLALAAGLLALAALTAPLALASEGIAKFETTSSTSAAGAHPDLTTSFELESPGTPESAKDVIFNAPEGIFGNPDAITQCTSVDFALEQCPSSSQAGLITIRANFSKNSKFLLGTAPIYDLQPGANTALFAFAAPTLNIPIQIPVSVRTGSDYGLTFTVKDITQLAPLASAKMTLWGFPAEEGHDAQRFPKGSPAHPAGCPSSATTNCIKEPTSAAISVHPLTDNPTTCTGVPLPTTLEVQTYQEPGERSAAESSYPSTSGCYFETFNPVLFASPTITETDSPSGLDLELSAAQTEGFAAAPSEIKSATVTLPPGFTINPDAADGQSMCTNAQANFSSEGPAECPDSAKIGTVAIHSSALNGTLEGSVYIGQPEPKSQYRLFEIASGFGLNLKLVGTLTPNPETGQLTASFENLPQVPFDEYDIHLFSGERSLMATPTHCTLYPVAAEFLPWDESLPEVKSTKFFGLESGPHGSECPGQVRPFEPTLEAGTATPAAGAFSSFTLKLEREDGDQYLGKLNFTMPPGLTADLRGIGYCPEAEIAAAAGTLGKAEQADPSCPASSEIGTTDVAAGPGSHPFHALGKLYLAGPFQGAPLSVVAITPALAGPYDYGTVVVRVAIDVDPTDAHVIADSETVPEIIGGIPLRMREIRVSIDRERFMINPTNCSPFAVGSEGIGDQGTAVAFSSYFHAVNCAALPFAPKMTVTQLGGRKDTKRAKDPSLRFDLDTRAGDANIKSLAVTLPSALEVDQKHLGNLCSKSELEASHCAGRQPIGTVSDETPLLEAPLEGLAYAVSGYTGLPHIAFILGGQVMIVPEAETKSVGERLRTTVPVIPDVPIGHFRLTLYGAKHGYLRNTRTLCAHPASATVQYTAQNGKTLTQRAPLKTACAKARRPKRHRH